MQNVITVLNALFLTIGYLAGFWGLPVIIILSLTYICRDAERTLDRTVTPKAEIYFGFIGIMIHEASHWLLAKIFNHQIIDCKLLVMPWEVDLFQPHSQLGYVRHAYSDRSFYQMVGNAFIGTAPIYGCTAILYLVFRLFMPHLFKFLTDTTSLLLHQPKLINSNYLLTYLGQVVSFTPRSLFLTFIGLLLLINITLTGFDLSDADLKNARTAGMWILIILAIVIFPLVASGMTSFLNFYLIAFISWLLTTFSLSLVIAVLVNVGCHVLHFFTN